MHTLIVVTTEFVAAAHLMMSLVLFYFSRRNIQFLAQAWIMLLICAMYCGALFYVSTREIPPLGMLHPVMLVYLVACSYLQSIYPLGLCMPGYLQWGRMWQYAAPALVLIFLYLMGWGLGSDFAKVYELSDIGEYLLSGDVLLRIGALALSGYYIINIFRLPHRLVRNFQLPPDLISYGTALGIVSLFFVVLTIQLSFPALVGYMLLFTMVNLSFFFRILRPVLQSISLPDIKPVEQPPTAEMMSKSELDDFNAANLHRFEAMEYLMQKEKPYMDCLFNRDKLCRMTGFNRHLVLQSLRSQGYNDVHEYINRYRVAELKRLVAAGEIRDLRQHERVGFRALKTAASNFERYEGRDLQAWFREQRGTETPRAEKDGGE